MAPPCDTVPHPPILQVRFLAPLTIVHLHSVPRGYAAEKISPTSAVRSGELWPSSMLFVVEVEDGCVKNFENGLVDTAIANSKNVVA